jgi:hypothetical protein
MVFEIKLNNLEDAKRLNSAAHTYDGKVAVSSGATMVDAKSLLALLTLIGKKNVNLVAPDHERPDRFMDFLKALGVLD